MVRHVPLVVYVDGKRQVIGKASVHEDGNVNAQFTSREMAERLRTTDMRHYSIGPSPDVMEEDIKKLRRRTQPVYRRKK